MVSQQEIHEHVTQLLDSEQFVSSRSIAKLLTFCVDAALTGNEENLKETTIGIFCFGRSPGYDTKLDPIVRVTARRLRNKLELFYQKEGENHEVRILLPKGTYVPRFHRSANHPPVAETEPVMKPVVFESVVEVEPFAVEKVPVEAPMAVVKKSSWLRPATWGFLAFLLLAYCGIFLTHAGLLPDGKVAATQEQSASADVAPNIPSIEQQNQMKRQVLRELSEMVRSKVAVHWHPVTDGVHNSPSVEPRL